MIPRCMGRQLIIWIFLVVWDRARWPPDQVESRRSRSARRSSRRPPVDVVKSRRAGSGQAGMGGVPV